MPRTRRYREIPQGRLDVCVVSDDAGVGGITAYSRSCSDRRRPFAEDPSCFGPRYQDEFLHFSFIFATTSHVSGSAWSLRGRTTFQGSQYRKGTALCISFSTPSPRSCFRTRSSLDSIAFGCRPTDRLDLLDRVLFQVLSCSTALSVIQLDDSPSFIVIWRVGYSHKRRRPATNSDRPILHWFVIASFCPRLLCCSIRGHL